MDNIEHLSALSHIHKMMERSSRFISLSGLSGVGAGICALIGAWLAYPFVYGYKNIFIDTNVPYVPGRSEFWYFTGTWVFWIAVGTFVAAMVVAFLFTWIKSKKQGIPLFGTAAWRVVINLAIPLVAGGIFLIRLLDEGTFGLIAPGSLIFYGIALLNASKYTFKEIRYLAISEIVLGVIGLYMNVGYGLLLWALGFGVLHILYGIIMWNKYERNKTEE